MHRSVRLLLVAALAGCRGFNPGAGAYSAQGTASTESFRCAQRTVSSLGYQVSSLDIPNEYLRASRDFDRSEDGEYTRGYLTVLMDRERDHRLRVYAERFAQEGRRVGDVRPRPEPMPRPPGRPRPYDTTDVIGRSRPRGSGPRRVNPGPAARHAREVVRRCSSFQGAADGVS